MSEYYTLCGIQALLVDSAIEWARRQDLPQNNATGLKIITEFQRSEEIHK